MIKAEELRIGNWVNSTQYSSNEPNHINYNRLDVEQINSIYENYDGTIINIHSEPSCYGYSSIYGIDLKYISGIPLTAEILEKCGFEKSKFYNTYLLPVVGKSYSYGLKLQNDGSYHFQTDESDAGCYFLCELHFVHQLQNLYFALTNTELTITI